MRGKEIERVEEESLWSLCAVPSRRTNLHSDYTLVHSIYYIKIDPKVPFTLILRPFIFVFVTKNT